MSMHVPTQPGILNRLSAPPRKAVLVGQTRVGGFLCTTPALRALKRALPETEMVMISVASLRDLVERSPHLDRFVAMPDLLLEQAQRPIDASGFTRFLRWMQEERFDLGIQLRGYGLRSSPYFVLLGAQTNVGFMGPADMPLLDASLPFPKEGHLVDRFLELSSFLGAPACGQHTEFPLKPEDHAAAEVLLDGAPRPLIGVHPTASEEERMWDSERFASVAARVHQRHGGTIVIVTEQPGHPAAEAIASRVQGSCLNLAGLTTLPVLGAVIERLAVLISNDTGPAHIGYAVGTPTVTLFAASSRTPFWPPACGPYRPLTCESTGSPDGVSVSMDTIAVSHVLAAVEEVFRF
jgi:ADP-heptose:LPS heptosyltransferase